MKFIASIFLFFALLSSGFGATYYIDYATGADANNGTAKATPWKHHPYQSSFTGSYSHSAGDRFIFKGGVTWPWASDYLNIVAGGGSGNHDYYGVDLTWYTGGAFTRPVFDCEYTGAGFFALNSNSYITLDNLEVKRGNQPADFYSLIGGGSCSNILLSNGYVHGWRRSTGSDGASGGITFATPGVGTATIILDNMEVENSENIGIQMSGVCVRAVGTIRNGSRIHDNSSAVLFCLDFDGSYLYNVFGNPFDGVYHPNGIYCDPTALSASTGYIRNSYLHDTAGGANMAYPVTRNGCNIYVYNNVMYGTQSSQDAINVDPDLQSGNTTGNCYIFNNTIVVYTTSAPAVHVTDRSGSGYKVNILTIENNHVIGTSAQVTDGSGTTVNTLSQVTNLNQAVATASGEGYVLGNLYAPTSTSAGTYNTGTTDSTTGSTSDILGVSRPQATVWDIGAYEFVSGAPGNATITISGTVTLKNATIK